MTHGKYMLTFVKYVVVIWHVAVRCQDDNVARTCGKVQIPCDMGETHVIGGSYRRYHTTTRSGSIGPHPMNPILTLLLEFVDPWYSGKLKISNLHLSMLLFHLYLQILVHLWKQCFLWNLIFIGKSIWISQIWIPITINLTESTSSPCRQTYFI